MKPKSKLRSYLALAGSSLLAISYAHAATGIWTQTGAGPFDWGTAANWSGSTIADGADFTASFSANITAAQTINLDAARTIGNIVAGDGSHDYTISGANTLTLDRTGGIPVVNVTPTGRALTISSVIDGNDGLDKWGAGQLNLDGSAVNSFTGGVKVSSGTLNLNFANLATPADLVNSVNTLTLGGGTLLITGNSTTDTNQTLGDVTVNAGGGRILVNPNDALRTATLTLGSITPAATGILLVGKSSGSSGTATITTTSGTLANDIYGGNMVFFNGTANTGYNWATHTGGGPAYTMSGLAGGSYTALPTSGGSATTNYQLATGTGTTTLTGGFSVNTLKMAPTGNTSVLALGGNTLTLEGGGLLFTGTASGNAISTGNLTAGAGSSHKLFVHSFNSTNTTISAAITNNGENAVALVVQNANAAGTAGFLALNGTNTFTGGIYLNNGAITVPNPGVGVGGFYALNNNTINVSGYSQINNANTTTGSTEDFTGAITLGDGAVLDFRNNTRIFTTSGAVTGKGGITLGQAGQGATTLNFNNTGNNFTGPVEYRVTPAAGQNGTLSVNSIGEADVLGSGDIRFGVAGTNTNVHIFNFGGTAGAPSGPLTFDKRRFELAGTHALTQINNNSAQDFTINTDLLVTANSGMLLTLGGTGAGISTYVGKIGDNPAGTTGVTALAAASTSGANTITLGSVTGITVGATITSTGTTIAAGTTITAINPVTKQVTLSPATAANGVLGQQMTVAGVTSNVSLTKAGSGTWVLSGANTHSGGTTIGNNGGTLQITTASALGTGLVKINTNGTGTGTLDLALAGTNNITNIFDTFGSAVSLTSVTPGNAQIRNTSGTNTITSNLTAQGNGGNGLNVVSNGGLLTLSGGITNVTSAGSLNMGGTGNGEVSGTITETIAGMRVTKSGVGTWTLSGASSNHTGNTVIASGTLALGTLASINASANISIAAGATFDVSQQTSPYTLSASTALSATGTGTTAGSTAARIVGPSAGVVSLGAQAVTLTWAGDTSGTDTDSPPLHVSQGALTLNNNAITINGPTLNVGIYRLIQVGDGVTGTLNQNGTPSYAVSGTAIDITKTNVISSDGSGNIILTVTAVGGITFADWKAANGNPAGDLGDDHDGDGVDNGTEFFLGGNTNTTGFTLLPAIVNSGGTLSVTWPKHPSYPGAYNTDFVVQTSDTLIGAWTTELTPPSTVTISDNNVTYTFPNPLGTKKFARLKVTGP